MLYFSGCPEIQGSDDSLQFNMGSYGWLILWRSPNWISFATPLLLRPCQLSGHMPIHRTGNPLAINFVAESRGIKELNFPCPGRTHTTTYSRLIASIYEIRFASTCIPSIYLSTYFHNPNLIPQCNSTPSPPSSSSPPPPSSPRTSSATASTTSSTAPKASLLLPLTAAAASPPPP